MAPTSPKRGAEHPLMDPSMPCSASCHDVTSAAASIINALSWRHPKREPGILLSHDRSMLFQLCSLQSVLEQWSGVPTGPDKCVLRTQLHCSLAGMLKAGWIYLEEQVV